MKKSSCLVLNFFPRGSAYFSGSNVRRTASDFFLPRRIRVPIDHLIEASDQVPCKFSPLVFRQGKSLLEEFLSFAGH